MGRSFVVSTLSETTMITHYTSKVDSVSNILMHGFAWVANRRELTDILIPHHNYSKREPQQFGMISFTDMTPDEASSHSGVFGPYGIVISDAWAKRHNAQRVVYIESQGPVTDALRALFDIGYRDCEARIRFPDDAGWNMAFENKAAAASIAGASLWANLLQLYEYMESAQFAREREWRIVNQGPYYGLAGRRTEDVIDEVSPPVGWANVLNMVKVTPSDVEAFICPSAQCDVFKRGLPKQFANIRIVETG